MAQAQQQQRAERYAQVVAKAWRDELFKQRLLGNPEAVLREHGLPLPVGRSVRVVENTPEVVHLVLPLKPAEGELSDDQLEHVAGGRGAAYTQGDLAVDAYPVQLGILNPFAWVLEERWP